MKPDRTALDAAATVARDLPKGPAGPALTATAPAGGPELTLTGIVGLDFTAAGLANALRAADSRDLTVRVNSPGGLVFEGFAIFNALARYQGNVTVVVEGIAGSAASWIPMAADEVVMPRASMLMIHNSSGVTFGTAGDHTGTADVLRKMDTLQASIYAQKTGKPEAEIAALMEAETYMTAEEAVAAKFADRVEDREVAKAVLPDAAAAVSALARLGSALPEASASPASLALAAHGPEHVLVAMATRPTTTPAKPVTKETDMKATLAQLRALAATAKLDDSWVLAQFEADATLEAASAAATAAKPAVDPQATATLEQLQALTARSNGRLDSDWVVKQLAAKATLDASRDAAVDAMAAAQPPRGLNAVITRDERDTFRAGMEEALAYRLGVGQATERARPLLGRPAMELARACIEVSGGNFKAIGGDNLKIAGAALNMGDFRSEAGMHSTSDFPNVLGAAIRRVLLKAYTSVPQDYRKLVGTENFEDFRRKSLVSLSDAASLDRVGEHGEFKYKSLTEGAESLGIDTWGNIYAFTRQALINDDLGALARAMSNRGVSAGKTVAKRVWWLIANGHTSQVKLSDGKAVFHADHGNLGAAGVIDKTGMGAAFKAMRTQKDANGDPIDVHPRYLIASPDREVEARTFLATQMNIQTGEANIFSGGAELIVTPWLTGNPWFVFADPALAQAVVIAFLNGKEDPRLEQRDGWNVEGVEYKVALDFDAGWIDYRPAYRNPGA